MREIKFRGKHIHAFIEPSNTGIWVYGYLCDDHYINSEELGGEMLVDKDTIGQYTGLHDKNGKEIYEGDIVKANWFDREDVIGEICFSMGCFILANSSVSDNQLFIFKSYEVIGNIYDNPELLKEN